MTDKSEDDVLCELMREVYYATPCGDLENYPDWTAGVHAVAAKVREIDAAKAKPAVEPKELWEVARKAYMRGYAPNDMEGAWRRSVDAIKDALERPEPKSAGELLFEVIYPSTRAWTKADPDVWADIAQDFLTACRAEGLI